MLTISSHAHSAKVSLRLDLVIQWHVITRSSNSYIMHAAQLSERIRPASHHQSANLTHDIIQRLFNALVSQLLNVDKTYSRPIENNMMEPSNMASGCSSEDRNIKYITLNESTLGKQSKIQAYHCES